MTREELLRVAEELYRICWLYVTPRERAELVLIWDRLHAPSPAPKQPITPPRPA